MCEGRSRIRTQRGIVICRWSQERNEGKNTIQETQDIGRIEEIPVQVKREMMACTISSHDRAIF